MRDMEGFYKARRRDGGGWIEGYFLIREPDSKPYISPDGVKIFEVDPSTLCRYTDMRDRKETPVYENDIINIPGRGNRLVEWSEENLSWMFSKNPYDDYDDYFSEISRRNVTVIGNLFEHGGLLEEPGESWDD